jgi:hypothetical protein
MGELDRFLYAMIPWLLGVLGLATAVALLAVIKYYLDVRQASFFILRGRSQRSLRNSLVMAAFLAMLTAGAFLAQRALPEPVQEPEATDMTLSAPETPVAPRATRSLETATSTTMPTRASSPTAPFIPTNTATITPSPIPTRTPTPTASKTPTPSITPSVTPTPSITPTPSPTVPVLEAIFTPIAPYATVPANALVEELVISRGIRVDGSPINPGDEFQEGQPVLYVSFRYDQMVDGFLWRHIWLRDGALFGGGTRLWEWGNRGRTYFYLRPTQGFLPGQYEVLFLLEEEVVQTASFTVE